jgi:hypothetical protein
MKPWTPTIVEGEGDSLDCLDYCQAVIDSPVMPHREKLQAAAIIAPYRHPKASSHYLSKHIDLDPPADIGF